MTYILADGKQKGKSQSPQHKHLTQLESRRCWDRYTPPCQPAVLQTHKSCSLPWESGATPSANGEP